MLNSLGSHSQILYFLLPIVCTGFTTPEVFLTLAHSHSLQFLLQVAAQEEDAGPHPHTHTLPPSQLSRRSPFMMRSVTLCFQEFGLIFFFTLHYFSDLASQVRTYNCSFLEKPQPLLWTVPAAFEWLQTDLRMPDFPSYSFKRLPLCFPPCLPLLSGTATTSFQNLLCLLLDSLSLILMLQTSSSAIGHVSTIQREIVFSELNTHDRTVQCVLTTTVIFLKNMCTRSRKA